MQTLERTFYDRDTQLVAQELLGKYLIHQHDGIERIGKIVEVEAYLGPHDLAAHSAKGLTDRTKVMFGPPGYAYIYLIYGMYYCMNVVTEQTGHASAVLIRAVEPIKN
ncbi:MAG TPA: DNA-3-methyladenine glycosylase, partial [Gammaproteobacteria bacterium]|nr:DNA-3-methyladenine glycosylase [Gammaproteobacteria bacterium]